MQQQTIGRYQVLEEIASGGQGTVYRAWDTSTGQIVALKVLHPHIAREASVLERFHREARLAAAVSHPNVTQIFEVGQDGESHFISMEFLPLSIHGLIESQGQLPIDRAVDIAQQTALALDAANRRGIIHRDIKPQNLLLAPDGTVKVTDFGIARATALSTMTRTGALMGTPYYMSPEQAQGRRVDVRSDIYSLGIVLYQLLTGRIPFQADTPWEVIRQHVEERPEPVRRVRSEVSRELERVIARCLEKDPQRRYRSPGELAQALRAAVPGIAQRAVTPQSVQGSVTPPREPSVTPSPSVERGLPRPPRSRGNPWARLGVVLAIAGTLAVVAFALELPERIGEMVQDTATPLAVVATAPPIPAALPEPTRVLIPASTVDRLVVGPTPGPTRVLFPTSTLVPVMVPATPEPPIAPTPVAAGPASTVTPQPTAAPVIFATTPEPPIIPTPVGARTEPTAVPARPATAPRPSSLETASEGLFEVHDDFSGGIGRHWHVYGSAFHQSIGSSGMVVLTEAESYLLGLLLHRDRVRVDRLQMEFSFEIGPPVGEGADGLALVVSRTIPTPGLPLPSYSDALGNDGHRFGSRILDGFAFEIDTHFNTRTGDPDDNHVGLSLLGGPEPVTLAEAGVPPLENSGVFDATIVFDSGAVEFWLGNSGIGMESTLVMAHTIEDFVPFDGYFGFLGQTGGSANRQVLHSVDFTVAGGPSEPLRVEGRGSTIASGWGFSCALTADGTPVCWGDDDGRASPPPGVRFTSITGGDAFGCGLRPDGSPICWGHDGDGQSSPLDDRFASISAGHNHVCGLRFDGLAACWGSDEDRKASPPPGERFAAISSGDANTCGLRSDGTVVCWGSDEHGRRSPPPGERFVTIDSGYDHTCGLTEDGTAVCWGRDFEGESSPPPEQRFTSISVGDRTSCGLQDDGKAICWGRDDEGQATPPPGERFAAIGTGDHHSCGITLDGAAVCWGWNGYGQASPETDERFTTPGVEQLGAGAVATPVPAVPAVGRRAAEPSGALFIGVKQLPEVHGLPSLCLGLCSRGVYQAGVTDTLLNANRDESGSLNLETMLATGWEIDDSLTRILVGLRQDVEFHAGFGRMTAGDVAFSFRDASAATNPESGHALRGQLDQYVRSVDVLDDYTVRFDFNEFDVRAVPHMPHILSPFAGSVGIGSKTAFDVVGAGGSSSDYPGVGAFVLDESSGEWRMRLNAFTDYYGAGEGLGPFVESVDWIAIPESSTRLAALLAGEMHITDLPAIYYRAVQDNGLELQKDGGSGRMRGLSFAGNYWERAHPETGQLLERTRDIRKPWVGDPFENGSGFDGRTSSMESSRKVRDALAWAIDRPMLNEVFVNGHGFVNHQPYLSVNSPHYDDDWSWGFDPDRGRELLVEAGYPDGFDMELWIGPDEPYGEIGGATASGWGEFLNVRVTFDRTRYTLYRPGLVSRTTSIPGLDRCLGSERFSNYPFDWPRGLNMSSLSSGHLGGGQELPYATQLYRLATSESEVEKRFEMTREFMHNNRYWANCVGLFEEPVWPSYNGDLIAEWDMRPVLHDPLGSINNVRSIKLK